MNVRSLALVTLSLAGLLAAPPALALTLEEARAQALKSHPRITTAQLRALIAEQSVAQAEAGRLPNLAANATLVRSGQAVTRIASGGLSNSQIFDHSGVGATLNWVVFDFGRTASLTEAARKKASAASADTLATRAQLLLQVDAAYLEVLKAKALKSVAEKTLAARQAFHARTQALAQNQLKSELDVRFAQVSIDEARLLSDAAEKEMLAAYATLANLIGTTDPTLLPELAAPPLPPALPGDFGPLTAQAFAQRPELGRHRAELEAAQATARAARNARLPSVSLIAAGGIIPTDHPQFDDRYAAGGINVNVPLFAGGLYRARQREAELQAEVADATLRDLRSTIARDVRLAWLEAVHAQQRIGLTRSLLDNARAALNLARARFEQGLTATVEITQAELAQTSAEIGHTNAEFLYRIRREMLDFQLGALQ